jgi:Mg/Co/Ni transporter MgtE
MGGNKSMTHVTALALCLAGFALLALATDRQQQAVSGRVLPSAVKTGMRLAAACALLLGLAVLVGSFGWSLGLVMFSGHTSLAAGLVHGALIAHGRLQG